ncbi:MAG: hypothetical protein ACN6RJ_09255 [Stenotrophomonas sp.]
MIIKAFQLRLDTPSGLFGISETFSRHLTIIKGRNSSGKSTFFNSLLYSIGMEELVGGVGPKHLTSAVRMSFDYEGQTISILSAETLVELENSAGEVITLRRAIKDETRDDRLVEIAKGAVITKHATPDAWRPTYIHGQGSASQEDGFFQQFELFLGLSLPRVGLTSGRTTKLYLQTVFAAHAIEQKRGWTDYIAGIPFYGIRDARTRVAEYLLGLGTFENLALKSELDAESSQINLDWRQGLDELRREASALGFSLHGAPAQVTTAFVPEGVQLRRATSDEPMALRDYALSLASELQGLTSSKADKGTDGTPELRTRISEAEQDLQRIAVLYDRASSHHALQAASQTELKNLLSETDRDLTKNKAVKRLQQMGAQRGVELAKGNCPSCHQPVSDSLVVERISGSQMDLESNIGYLESQRRMLSRQLSALEDSLIESEVSVRSIAQDLDRKRDRLTSLKEDLGSSAQQEKAALRRAIQLELEIGRLDALTQASVRLTGELASIADRLRTNQQMRTALPKNLYTDSDEATIGLFEKNFRANAGSFGYTSVANIRDVSINEKSLTPSLSDIELREYRQRPDIKSESSASDFVRLIWAYLIALYQASQMSKPNGHHLGFLLMDEPGQHSMSQESQRALFKTLIASPNLQSIVAASFDESPSIFRYVTDGVAHKLISWEGKLIGPLDVS